MAIARIAQPFIIQEGQSNSPCVQKDAVPEIAASNWLAGSLVFTSGVGAAVVLNVVPTAGTLVYGQSPDAAKVSTTPAELLKPPFALFGLNHFPFDLRDRIVEVNAVSGTAGNAVIGTANGVTWAGGGTNGVALAPAQKYGLFRASAGTYNLMQFLDVNNTVAAQQIFEIVALAPNQSVNDNNPRVWTKIVEDKIQG